MLVFINYLETVFQVLLLGGVVWCWESHCREDSDWIMGFETLNLYESLLNTRAMFLSSAMLNPFYWRVSTHRGTPDCFLSEYWRVSDQRRAPPAGSTALRPASQNTWRWEKYLVFQEQTEKKTWRNRSCFVGFLFFSSCKIYFYLRLKNLPNLKKRELQLWVRNTAGLRPAGGLSAKGNQLMGGGVWWTESVIETCGSQPARQTVLQQFVTFCCFFFCSLDAILSDRVKSTKTEWHETSHFVHFSAYFFPTWLPSHKWDIKGKKNTNNSKNILHVKCRTD